MYYGSESWNTAVRLCICRRCTYQRHQQAAQSDARAQVCAVWLLHNEYVAVVTNTTLCKSVAGLADCALAELIALLAPWCRESTAAEEALATEQLSVAGGALLALDDSAVAESVALRASWGTWLTREREISADKCKAGITEFTAVT